MFDKIIEILIRQLLKQLLGLLGLKKLVTLHELSFKCCQRKKEREKIKTISFFRFELELEGWILIATIFSTLSLFFFLPFQHG